MKIYMVSEFDNLGSNVPIPYAGWEMPWIEAVKFFLVEEKAKQYCEERNMEQETKRQNWDKPYVCLTRRFSYTEREVEE